MVTGGGGFVGYLLSSPDGFKQALFAFFGAVLGFLVLAGITFIVMWFRAPYKQRDEARKQSSEFEAILKQVREEIQVASGYRLIRIPEILSEITNMAIKIADEKKKINIMTPELLDVVIEVLDIEGSDPLLSLDKYNKINKRKIASMIKVFRVRMGLKKKNTRKAEQWTRRIIKAMNGHNIGLNLHDNEGCNNLFKELEKHRMHISGLRLDASIENYLLHMEGLWDIKLMMIYCDIYKHMRLFPQEITAFLEELQTMEYGIMRRELILVNQPLERWLGGATE
ncbi:hypothetical protein ACFLUP_00815 [Chloroflexota bacterium]